MKTPAVGDFVIKPTGYPFPGVVVSRFTTVGGKLRFVVESTILPGLLHIFSPEQLEKEK